VISLMNNDGSYIYHSPSIRSLTGYLPDEIKTNSQFEIHPDDKDKVDSAFMDMFYNRLDAYSQYRLRHKNGHYVWVETISHYTGNDDDAKIVSVTRNIEQRKKLELGLVEALFETNKQKEIIDNSPVLALNWKNRKTWVMDYISQNVCLYCLSQRN
jgi:PAS domain S-box-containing protein